MIICKDYLKKIYNITGEEYIERQKRYYTAKDCHSFWHRECTNKGTECHHCNKFYSIAEWDKMSKKYKNNIKNT